jgi:hypothetical protein
MALSRGACTIKHYRFIMYRLHSELLSLFYELVVCPNQKTLAYYKLSIVHKLRIRSVLWYMARSKVLKYCISLSAKACACLHTKKPLLPIVKIKLLPRKTNSQIPGRLQSGKGYRLPLHRKKTRARVKCWYNKRKVWIRNRPWQFKVRVMNGLTGIVTKSKQKFENFKTF